MRLTSEMGFDAEWLALREASDMVARDADLLARAMTYAGSGATLLDLGCGTGATARVFESAGAQDIRWRFFDNDPELLQRAAARHPQAEIIQGDLADIDELPLAGVRLVTASALLDLVSRNWMERFAARLASERVALYATLSYDGVMNWTPLDPEDALITERFNAHQRGDKEFGPALGPDAAESVAQILGARGYSVSLAPSPWRLGATAADMQRALLHGIAQAALEMGHATADQWIGRRKAHLSEGWAEIGHMDLLALPPS
uniref:class I SAM-dependent methyltransferase n=1 Tax=Roseovarius sp. BRH_c41 TaxID=1629709 RepID=UPI0025CD38C6|nr:class I SAM-dependent methyltransferase [Roseovarius sp. BRH_c41]